MLGKKRQPNEKGDCPHCKAQGTLAINTFLNLSYCFTCGWHGPVPLRLVK